MAAYFSDCFFHCLKRLSILPVIGLFYFSAEKTAIPKNLTVLGYGSTDQWSSKMSRILREADVNYIGRKKCRQMLQKTVCLYTDATAFPFDLRFYAHFIAQADTSTWLLFCWFAPGTRHFQDNESNSVRRSAGRGQRCMLGRFWRSSHRQRRDGCKRYCVWSDFFWRRLRPTSNTRRLCKCPQIL